MAGPSLLQVLLGRPSQKYSMPAPKQYYSDKATMMRIAASTDGIPDAPRPLERQDDDDDADADSDVFYTPRSSVASVESMLTTTTPPTSDADHTQTGYTDQDWAQDIHWLATAIQKPKPKRAPVPMPPPRSSRSPTPSIMMSMTALLEEDEDPLPVPQKICAPASSVLVSHPRHSSSRSSSAVSPLAASGHRRVRSHGTASTSSSYYVPPPPPSGPPELPSYGTPAYTSLAVPAAPTSSQSLGRSTSISKRIRASLRGDTADLSRSRLAQTTMASVEVVGGLASPSHAQPPRLGFTHYRTPPHSVPKAGVLVQVWAVALDAVDLRLLGVHSASSTTELTRSRTQSFGRFVGRTMSMSRRTASDVGSISDKDSPQAGPHVGFVPGRSFVGRVLECGWEVRDEVVRRGEWVVGLLDVRKSGALAEFITVDRHRIHRVPHPHTPSSDESPAPSLSPPSSGSSDTHSHQNQDSPYPSRPSSVSFRDSPPPSRASSRQHHKRVRPVPPPPPPPPPGLTLAELALLPLGLAAHRVVRTLAGGDACTAWGSVDTDTVRPDGEPEAPLDEKRALKALGRRALVLQGHAGTGGLVARMLARRGWRVCVHAPGSLADGGGAAAETDADRAHMRRVQARVRAWGVEEVVFDDGGGAGERGDGGRGAAVRAVERLIGDGDAFDAVVDTVGGRAVWEAGERLLAGAGAGRKQFTTTVGDWPGRPVPTAKDNFRAGLRALRGNQSQGGGGGGGAAKKGAKRSEVGYAWVSAAQDVDWEGADVRDALGAMLRLALEGGVRPVVEAEQPFERAPEVFERGGGEVLRGGSVVVKVVG
ncbi:hypothetical protein B0H17DRAFT_1208536 [Mycena rosella]|uniref:Uncharacterized protein n=1 Tax=Mycena rosella TaxID=1033263 RepID=A0AAD7D495_MYCRO|nr:hypothetical protein B0H17DRAFT_1208536 [Mycena rosella]